jgi:hypothetical protein
VNKRHHDDYPIKKDENYDDIFINTKTTNKYNLRERKRYDYKKLHTGKAYTVTGWRNNLCYTDFENDYINVIIDEENDTPSTIKEALNSIHAEKWKEAIDTKMDEKRSKCDEKVYVMKKVKMIHRKRLLSQSSCLNLS